MFPANASTGTATIAGTGKITPGLLVGAIVQETWSFTGSGAILTDTVNGTLNCVLTGDDTIGNVQQGAGNFDGNCTTPCGSSTVSGSFTRGGGVVKASGSAFGSCLTGGFTAACTFVPVPPPPVTAFYATCSVTFA
jgi:hypothetical protein